MVITKKDAMCPAHVPGKGGEGERGVEGRHGIYMVVFLTRGQRKVQRGPRRSSLCCHGQEPSSTHPLRAPAASCTLPLQTSPRNRSLSPACALGLCLILAGTPCPACPHTAPAAATSWTHWLHQWGPPAVLGAQPTISPRASSSRTAT